MSGGRICRCTQRGDRQKNWFVTQDHCNRSAFNGYHYTPSEWSAVRCVECGAYWRTKANYVDTLNRASQAQVQKMEQERREARDAKAAAQKPCFECNGTGEMCDVCGEAENACKCDLASDPPPTRSDCEACGGSGWAS